MGKARIISLKEFKRIVNSNQRVRVVDVRTHSEYKEQHIPSAENFPIDRISAGEFVVSPGEIIVATCGIGGGRSENAANLIATQLEHDVYFLEGGSFGWFKNEGLASAGGKSFIEKFVRIGQMATDTQDERLAKSSLLLVSIPSALAGIVWGSLYLLNNMLLPGSIPFCYGILSLVSIIVYLKWKHFNFFRFSQILLILLLPFALQLSLGGFVPASAVILWSLISPLGALVFYSVRQSRYWFAAFALVIVAAFALNDYLPSYVDWNLNANFINRLFLMNVLGVSALIYFMQYYFVEKQTELKQEVELKSDELSQKNKEITDSINYAKRIQFTLMSNEDSLKSTLSDHFVFFKPKDIVSGDFYWTTTRGNKFYLAVCDSTGHGVPGAFMSILNMTYLNEAINEKGIELPNEICNYVRQKLIDKISNDGSQDGMDGIILCLDQETNKLTFAAAHNSPFLVRSKQGIELGADKMPIGKGEKQSDFKLNEIQMSKGDRLYLYTDGYADQFGGPKGKKFKYRQLQDLLVSISDVSFIEQKKLVEAIHNNWRGILDQTDDILMIGLVV